MSGHTPTPRAIISTAPCHDGDGYGWGGDCIVTIDGRSIILGPKDDKLAELIAEAVNAYTATPSSDLVKALEWIEYHYANQDMNHEDFRVEAYSLALEALTRHRQGEKAKE